jgi:5'(3')-deoxyribonucleotidase
MNKPVLAIDCDDVLCHYIPSLLHWHNQLYQTNYSLCDVKSGKLEQLWQCDAKQTVDKINAFSQTEEYGQLLPIVGAAEALHKLKTRYELVIVTARDFELTHKATELWIETHFSGLFTSIHYGFDKASICKKLNAQALIDDSMKNITNCSRVLQKVILFTHEGQYPWSENMKQDDLLNLSICPNWRWISQLMMAQYDAMPEFIN